MKSNKQKLGIIINEKIKEKEIRLIGEDGKQIGIMPLEKAIEIAKEKGLDVILINKNTRPVVCKLLDYDKYRYILQKQEKEKKKKQKLQVIKEIRIKAGIQNHDYELKLQNIRRFIEEGEKVRMRVLPAKFTAAEAVKELTQKIIEDTSSYATLEMSPKQIGKINVFLLSPKKRG